MCLGHRRASLNSEENGYVDSLLAERANVGTPATICRTAHSALFGVSGDSLVMSAHECCRLVGLSTLGSEVGYPCWQ